VATINALLGADESSIQMELMFLGFHKFMCVKDWSDRYCFPQIQQAQIALSDMGSTCGALILTNQQCSADCRDKIKAVKEKLGCCFGTWFSFVRFQFWTNQTFRTELHGITPAAITNYVTDSCQLTIPRGCARQKLRVVLTLMGLEAAWVAAHPDYVKRAVVHYIMYLLHVDNTTCSDPAINQVTSQVVQGGPSPQHLMAAGSTTATFDLLFDSENQVDSCKQGLSQGSIDADPTTPILADLPIAARNQQDVDTVPYVQAASVTVQPDGSNSAFAKAPSFLAIFVIGLLSFLM